MSLRTNRASSLQSDREKTCDQHQSHVRYHPGEMWTRWDTVGDFIHGRMKARSNILKGQPNLAPVVPLKGV